MNSRHKCPQATARGPQSTRATLVKRVFCVLAQRESMIFYTFGGENVATMPNTSPISPVQATIRRALNKVAEKFPPAEEMLPLTDLYIRLKPEGGELLVFDDDDNEVTRCVVEDWIGDTSEDFYDRAAVLLRDELAAMQKTLAGMGLLKPFSFVMQDEEGENLADLYLVDSDRIVLDSELMKGLDKDLDSFLRSLMER